MHGVSAISTVSGDLSVVPSDKPGQEVRGGHGFKKMPASGIRISSDLSSHQMPRVISAGRAQGIVERLPSPPYSPALRLSSCCVGAASLRTRLANTFFRNSVANHCRWRVPRRGSPRQEACDLGVRLSFDVGSPSH